MRLVMFSSRLDVALELELLLREERRQVLEHDLVLALLGREAVDLVDLDQREVALAVLRHPDLAFDHVAGVQVEAAHLARREVDVVGRRHVARFGRAQEAEAVGQDLEDAVAEDLLAVLGALLHDREHQLLLAHAGDVLDLQRLAHLDELGDVDGLSVRRGAWGGRRRVRGGSGQRTGAVQPGCRGCVEREPGRRTTDGREAKRRPLRGIPDGCRSGDRERSVPARAGWQSRPEPPTSRPRPVDCAGL